MSVQDSSFLGRLRVEPDSEAEGLDGLATRAAHGDRIAFEQIYFLLAKDIYSYVRRQCQNEQAAEDLVANVFLKAWRSAKQYQSGSNWYRRWIFTIARNEIRDHWRRRKDATFPLGDIDMLDESGTEPVLDAADANRKVALALSTLTDDQRQVVVLKYFSEKSHEEIAAIMGKREGAVRALLLRALRSMRKVMVDAAP